MDLINSFSIPFRVRSLEGSGEIGLNSLIPNSDVPIWTAALILLINSLEFTNSMEFDFINPRELINLLEFNSN